MVMDYSFYYNIRFFHFMHEMFLQINLNPLNFCKFSRRDNFLYFSFACFYKL